MLLLLLTLATTGEAFRTGSGFVPNFSAIHPPLQRHPGHTVATERRFFHARRHDAQPFQLHMSSESDSEVEALLARAAQLRAEAASIEATKAAEKAEQISKAFSQFDSNRDGVISYDELVGGLEKQFGFQGKPEGVMIEAAVKKLFQDLDKDGNDVIDESEFKLSLREMSARIESYIREEKDKERIRKLEAREAEEKARKAEAKLAFLNEKDPTNTDKVLSVLPYLFPLLDGLQYGRFLLQGTDNIVVQSVAVLYVLYRSIPFSGFVAFFAIQFLSANTKLNRLIRFNLNQAIFVDIALIFPGLIGGIGKAALPGLGVELPAGLGETLTDGVFFALLATLAYCAISSLLGEEPNKLPLISKTVNDRMPTIDMFNDEGFFIGRPRKGNRGDGDGDGDGKGGGDDAKNDKS